MNEKPEYLGPRTLRAEQLAEVIALANRVFRSTGGGDMGRQYPLIFHPGRLEQLRIFEHGGQLVSMVSTVLNDTVLLGCPVRVACLGSVCTDEAHRGRGLADRLVADAAARATAAGAAVMLISGGRTLYSRRGAISCGRFPSYELARSALPPPEASLEIAQVDRELAAEALPLFEAEPLRFRRTIEDYVTQIESGWTVNRPGLTYRVRGPQGPLAVASFNRFRGKDDPAEVLTIQEMAGSREAILAAAGGILDSLGVSILRVRAYETDRAAAWACARLGAMKRPARTFDGTVKLLSAEKLWSDFLPLLAERAGEAVRAVRLAAEADEWKIETLTFALGRESLTLHGPKEMMDALFGCKGPGPLAEKDGPLAALLRKALPLPLPMYGLNYA